jgi:DNA (cytosine-5)-methyltransferase 1
MARIERTRPIGIDLFAGAGGLSLGFEQAGFDIAAAVEIDPIHAAAHEFNFPNCTTLCTDIAKIDGAEIRRRAGIGKRSVAVVFGGAPCQGFSTIGKRAFDDPRNHLVSDFVRIVQEIRPRYFVFENVKGLTLGKHRAFLDELIEALSVDYKVLLPYRVLNAADYGVPQDRRRLFLVGARKGERMPAYPEPLPKRVTVREAIGDIPDADQFSALMLRDSVPAKFGRPSAYARRLRGLANEILDYAYRREFDPSILTASLRAEHTALSRSRFAATEPGSTEPISRFHKLDPLGVCNTLRAGTASDRGAFTSPRPIHYAYPRCITVREAARLHSYPDWFRFHVTKWHGFRQLGNSVPPILGQAIAAAVLEAMREKPILPKPTLALGAEQLITFGMTAAADYFGVPDDTIAKRRRTADRLDPDQERTAA